MEYIYFFKHKGIDAVKIGRTLNVTQRFSDFSIYSPFGSEILGFIRCENSVQLEKTIHKDYSQFRLSGEFFTISIEQIKFLINKYDNDIENLYRRIC